MTEGFVIPGVASGSARSAADATNPESRSGSPVPDSGFARQEASAPK
jgi:hypothetical protein